MKFGKHIQKQQLDIPEYASSFVDYKALKKLIKKLSATPIIQPQNNVSHGAETLDPQASLQANKATFFFRLERELEKVNTFYLQKEAELRLRLTTLLDKKRSMQASRPSASKLSSKYISLEEGFRQFSSDLNKLQQFVEVNATAFSKILKKWDKTSKSRTKELYLSRAVEVQPCFNRDVISDFSDQATTNLLEFGAWAEGEKIQFSTTQGQQQQQQQHQPDVSELIQDGEVDLEPQTSQAIAAGNTTAIQNWINRMTSLPDGADRITKAFLSTMDDAPESSLRLLLDTSMVKLDQEEDINERNCLHKAAICGRGFVLDEALRTGVNAQAVDIYGRIPLHYTSMHGRPDMISSLVSVAPETIDIKDQDNFTSLLHAIAHSELACVEIMLDLGASIDPSGDSDHIPLNFACQHGSREVVELLLQKRPRILPDAEGLYPQHLVARYGFYPGLLLTLKEYGADLDQPDKLYQWTPLFHTASEGKVQCLETLLQCGVTADASDEKGLSAMYYATWEGHLDCMALLADVSREKDIARMKEKSPQILGSIPPSQISAPLSHEGEGIPDLSLPPPIIPIRRYGHNFLESKTFVVISFESLESEAIQFYDDQKYPAARLTISSKSSDLIPRNILLPIQDEFRVISFQIDNLDAFAIDFDVYPTFGSKVIARTVASSRVFTGKASSSGHWHLELMDPRLRAIGRISFNFNVVKPFQGIPLEITHFATYWKATSPFDSQHNALITGSSLSGDYARLFVQMTADNVPVLHPRWKINHHGLWVPVGSVTYEQFLAIGAEQRDRRAVQHHLTNVTPDAVSAASQILATSFMSLQEALACLPATINVEVHVLYPNRAEEEAHRLGPTPNINDFADALLRVIFDHARHLRQQSDGFLRSMVFSSFNQDICTALNWKQPNYPILLCNGLSADNRAAAGGSLDVQSSGRTTISVKEAVRIARGNNFMGLICSLGLLELAPSLVEAIKTAGLVLVADTSYASSSSEHPSQASSAASAVHTAPDGVDGLLKSNGTLKFNDTIDL